MKIDLSEVARTPGMKGNVQLDEACPEDMEITCTAPVKGHLEFSNTGTLLLIEGELSTEVEIECGRCLVDFKYPVESTVEEEYRVEKVGDSYQVLPLDEDDVSPDLIVNNMLDVQELIRQSLLVVLPIQPLCKPGCEGLCPTCGENLNVRKCQCPPAEIESPFKVLSKLLEEDEEKSE